MVGLFAHRDESGRVGKPGLDECGGVEEDIATLEGVDEGREVSDVAIDELESGVGGRKGAQFAAPPHEGADGVAFLEQPVAEATAEITGRPRHKYCLHCDVVKLIYI